MSFQLAMLPSDTKFFNSPDAGDPHCLCSRCGKKIEDWHSPGLRAWPQSGKGEYRYHFGCVGGTDKTKEQWEAEQNDFFDDLYY